MGGKEERRFFCVKIKSVRSGKGGRGGKRRFYLKRKREKEGKGENE